MKTYIKHIAYIAVCSFAYAHSMAQPGLYMEYGLTSSKAGGTTIVYITEKASRTEMEMKIPQMPNFNTKVITLVYANKPDAVYMVDEKSKTYSIIIPDNTHHKSTYQIKNLPDETVSGYACKHFYLMEGKETTEIWNTKNVADYQKFKKAYSAIGKYDDGYWAAMEKAGVEGVPVKIVYNEEGSKEKITMTLKKLESKTLPESLFSINGYKQTQSPAIPGMPAGLDMENLQNMTPEQQKKLLEQLQKQYSGE